MYVLFPPDLENFKLKGVGTFSPIPLLSAIFDVFSETFCINYANFPDFNSFGKIVSSFGDKLFFFPMYPKYAWNFLDEKGILKRMPFN